MAQNKAFFEWVAKCCELAGWPIESGKYMLPDSDPSWYYCYDDGMTPEEAVRKYTEKSAESV